MVNTAVDYLFGKPRERRSLFGTYMDRRVLLELFIPQFFVATGRNKRKTRII